MISLPNRASAASSSRRFSSTSPCTYLARMILKTRRRDSTSTARDALHGASRPSRRTPESKKTLGRIAGLPLAIQALETAPANLRQMFESFIGGDAVAD